MTNSPSQLPGAEKKIAAGVCGIVVGSLGIHKFLLGYTLEGCIMLGIWLAGMLTGCFVVPLAASVAIHVIGIVEGIIYLTKTDEEFVNTYINSKKGWF